VTRYSSVEEEMLEYEISCRLVWRMHLLKPPVGDIRKARNLMMLMLWWDEAESLLMGRILPVRDLLGRVF
jgi:hypothetical protein